MITDIAWSESNGATMSRSGERAKSANSSVPSHDAQARAATKKRRARSCTSRIWHAPPLLRNGGPFCATRFAVDELADEKAILERIRAHLGNGASQTRPPRQPVEPSTTDAAIDVAALRGSQDIYALPLRSQRAGIGPGLVLLNRLLRKLLKPSLERQVAYNAANERLIRLLLAEMESLKAAQTSLNERCDALQSALAALRDPKQRG